MLLQGRGRVAVLALALTALAAALIAGVGPAVPERASYSWPPPALPDAHPTRTWFAPLLLNRQVARTIEARVPCSPGATHDRGQADIVILATARHPRPVHALEVVRPRGQEATVVRVGRTELARIPATAAARPCTLDIRFEGGRWSIRRDGAAAASGRLAEAPTVYGFVTGLDLRRHTDFHVTVQPIEQDTRPSGRQTGFRVLAALLITAATVLLLRRRRHDSRQPYPRPRILLPDGAVAATLAVWWVISPVYPDDGWVKARQTNSLVSGGFSNYYDHSAANLPLVTWLEWGQHFVVAHTSSLLVQRLPSVLCLGALWLVCRWTLSTLVGAPARRGDSVWWSATLAFCVGATAFGVTLRPEPMIALLAAGVLAAMVRFCLRPGTVPLVVAVLLSGLAVTAHPAGLAAASPLLICVPRIIREARRRIDVTPVEVAAIAVMGAAWTILVAFIDSDVAHRRSDAALLREGYGQSYGWRYEPSRYNEVWQYDAAPLRREFVALCLLAVLALFFGELWRRRPLELRLPSASLAFGLLLLSFTPSKWAWHFGGFIGLCAVAIGVEVARLRQGGRWESIPLVASVACVTAFTTVAVAGQAKVGQLDPQTIWWAPLPSLAIVIATSVLVVAATGVTRLGNNMHWRPALWCLPLLLATILAMTTLSFAAGAAAKPTWSVPRQVLGEVVGRDSCGLANDIVVPISSSLAATPTFPTTSAGHAERRIPFARVSGASVFAAPATTPWFQVGSRPFGVYVGGRWRSPDSLWVEWGNGSGGRVRVLGRAPVDLGLARVAFNGSRWRFVQQPLLPPRPKTADLVRLVVVAPSSRLARPRVTGPISYAPGRLERLLANRSSVSLVSPFLLSVLPCARIPEVTLGAAEPPGLLVDTSFPPSMTDPTGPFRGLPDLYDITLVAMADRTRFDDVSVYDVAVNPRDAIAEVTRRRR